MVVERVEANGCELDRVYAVTDACGNTAEQVLRLQRPGDVNSVTASIVGYRCTPESCDIQVDNLENFQDGDLVARPAFVAEIGGEPGCVSEVEAVVMPADRVVDECPPVPPMVTADDGGECDADADCGGAQTCQNGTCVEPEECAADADCRGSRYCDGIACTSPCQSFESGSSDRGARLLRRSSESGQLWTTDRDRNSGRHGA